MVVELDMEQTTNTNLALFFEAMEWFNTTYYHIFVDEHPFLPSVENNKVQSKANLITRPLIVVNLIPPSGDVK